MKIKKLQFKNFLGIEEIGIEPGKVNLIQGPKGSSKSSIIEGIEKTFTNKNRRTEVIKHGADEATLFVELDNGLEIDRRVRNEKADYLKLRKDNESVPSTEKFLRSLINGEIFRPVDWVNMDIKEQTKSILSMLEIGWSMEDIEAWFGETPSNIDFNQHILQILKAIEIKYYKDREEVNRAIRELVTQINVIKKDLPVDYDGEFWREKKVQEYYAKVSEAQKINKWVEEAKALQANYEAKVSAIKANADAEKSRINLKFINNREDIKDIIELSKSKIQKSKTALENADSTLANALKESENDYNQEFHNIAAKYQETLKKLEDEYNQKMKEASNKFEEEKANLTYRLQESKEALQRLNVSTKETEKETIGTQENKIAAKEQELVSLTELEKQELKAVDDKTQSEIEKEQIRVGKAAEYLKNNEPMDIEPLQKEADEVADMQSYLRQWDMMLDIRDNKLAAKEQYAALLTSRIDKARTLPSELLKTAKMPIEGISVDEKGLIRINDTLIDGLSDGEKLELAMKIAKAQAGELKVICLDRWESLDKLAQEKLIGEITDDEFQYFITQVSNTEENNIVIEKLA